MQLLTERLFLIPLQPDGMRALLARTTDPELIQPYTDMLDLSLSHPEATSMNPIFTMMIFFFTPIIFAAIPTHRSRFARSVSCRSFPT